MGDLQKVIKGLKEEGVKVFRYKSYEPVMYSRRCYISGDCFLFFSRVMRVRSTC